MGTLGHSRGTAGLVDAPFGRFVHRQRRCYVRCSANDVVESGAVLISVGCHVAPSRHTGYSSKEAVESDGNAKAILADLGRYHVLPPVQPMNVSTCVNTARLRCVAASVCS